MINQSKKLLKYVFLPAVLVSMFLTMQVNASSAVNLTLFGDTLDNVVTGNCYLRKEYNYFMNQWTTNEVCNPRITEAAPRSIALSAGPARDVVDNIYLGSIPNTRPVSYSQPAYYGGTTANNYRGYYANNPSAYTSNSWNGYGSAANYLLGSFGGGYGGNTYGSLTSPYYNYGSYSYPNSVSYYTPTVYDRFYDEEDDWVEYWDDEDVYYPPYEGRGSFIESGFAEGPGSLIESGSITSDGEWGEWGE